jgi:hypothetical protein
MHQFIALLRTFDIEKQYNINEILAQDIQKRLDELHFDFSSFFDRVCHLIQTEILFSLLPLHQATSCQYEPLIKKFDQGGQCDFVKVDQFIFPPYGIVLHLHQQILVSISESCHARMRFGGMVDNGPL